MIGSFEMRRDLVAGGLAGLAGGLVLTLAALGPEFDGLLGLAQTGPGLALQLLVSVPLGAVFGGVFRYQPGAYAALLSNGLLFALLVWILGPLTLEPALSGVGPTWSAATADAMFSALIGHLLYGGVTGTAFYALVALHQSRRSEQPQTQAEKDTRRVVILGGGFGGISAAQRLERIFWRDPDVEIVVISDSNYLLFTPMLAEVAGSALEPQHISAPIRASLPRTRFRRAAVKGIDTEAQEVRCRSGDGATVESVRYSHLVLALGSVPNYFGLPGMEENAFTLKTLDDATRLRNHVITLLEQADVSDDVERRRRMLTFLVAGGGFAGTELIAEICDLVNSVLRFYPNIPRDELRFVLVHSRDRILPELSDGLADYALAKLRARGVEFFLGARVGGASDHGVTLGDGEEIPSSTIVWTAGNQPNPILATLPCERNRAGAVLAEATLALKGFDNIWVVGDCGEIPDVDREGATHPPTAQHAIREGKMAARNIAAALDGKPLRPFRFRTLGTLVPLGHRMGVAEIRGMRFSGLLAWLMWRGIYLSLLPGFEKKVRVLFDWSLDLFFPRDIVLTADATAPTLTETVSARAAPVEPPAFPVDRAEGSREASR